MERGERGNATCNLQSGAVKVELLGRLCRGVIDVLARLGEDPIPSRSERDKLAFAFALSLSLHLSSLFPLQSRTLDYSRLET